MEIVIETFLNPGEASSNPIRVRPISGQKVSQNFRVSCSVKVRESKEIGALFKVNVTLVEQPSAKPYLRINPNEQWVPITHQEALVFLNNYK